MALCSNKHLAAQTTNKQVLTFDAEIEGTSDRRHRLVVDALALVLAGVLVLNVLNDQLLAEALDAMVRWKILILTLPVNARRWTEEAKMLVSKHTGCL